jgi:hypothetical protein
VGRGVRVGVSVGLLSAANGSEPHPLAMKRIDVRTESKKTCFVKQTSQSQENNSPQAPCSRLNQCHEPSAEIITAKIPNRKKGYLTTFPLTLSFHYVMVKNIVRALDFVLASQSRDGGWGYKPGGMSYVEPTAAVLLALAGQTGGKEAYSRGCDFLRDLQHQDGGWGIAALDAESGWMTAWAVWALAGGDKPSASRGAEWLLQTEGIRITDPAAVSSARNLFRMDARLTGWPWLPGDASWVFPTALALLALNATAHSAHPRVQEGIRYLLDRAIPSGGWNIGDPFLVTGTPPATVVHTSIVLVSLGGLGISNGVVQDGQRWVAEKIGQVHTAAELAWGSWAVRTAQLDDGSAGPRLQSLQLTDGSWDANPLTTAVAMMGLGAG